MIKTLGIIAALVLPLWNIPLMIRIIHRKSSKDFSLWWTFGVWFALLAMLPAALISEDFVFKVFNLANLAIFTAVVVLVIRYHR
jgi:uncharacterized protein with PQ loop repeat